MNLNLASLRTLVENTYNTTIVKPSPGTAVAGYAMDTWRTVGSQPAGPIATDASGITYSKDSLNAPEIIDNVAGHELRLIQARIQGSFIGGIIAVDRLVMTTGLNLDLTTPQTVDSVPLPRYTDGEGVEMFLVNVVAGSGGTLGTKINVSYTNQAGVSGRTGSLIGLIGAVRLHTVQKIALEGNDTGVRSVQSVTSEVAGRLGTYGILLVKRVVSFPVTPTVANQIIGGTALGFPKIDDNICLNLWYTMAIAGGAQVDFKFARVPI